jgi:hypothetical protein
MRPNDLAIALRFSSISFACSRNSALFANEHPQTMVKMAKFLVWVSLQAFSSWLVISAILLAFLGFAELEGIAAAPENVNSLRAASFWASIAVFRIFPWVALFVAIVSVVSWAPASLFRSARFLAQRGVFVSAVTCVSAAWVGILLALSSSPLHMNDLPPTATEILAGSVLGAIIGFVFAVATDWMSNRLALLLPTKFKL